eukprot:jgi/Bigna1/141336/aug1.62_g16044
MRARTPQKYGNQDKKKPLAGITFDFSFDAKPKKRKNQLKRQKSKRKKEKIRYPKKSASPKIYQSGMGPIVEPTGIDFTNTIQVTSWRVRTAKMIYEKGRRFTQEGDRMRKTMHKPASPVSNSKPIGLSSPEYRDGDKSKDNSNTKPDIDAAPCQHSVPFSNAPSPTKKKGFCFKTLNDNLNIKSSTLFANKKGESSNRSRLVLKMPKAHSSISQSARRPHQNTYSVGKSRTPRTARKAGSPTYHGSRRGSRNRMMFRHTFPVVREAQQAWKIHGTKVAQSNREEMYIRRLQNLTLQKSNNLQKIDRKMSSFDYSPRRSHGQKGKKAWAAIEKEDFQSSIQHFEETVLRAVVRRRIKINGSNTVIR